MAKTTQKDTPKQDGKRTRQGTPKRSAEVNAAKKAKGNGQENVAWNAKTGRQDNAEGNTEDKKKVNATAKSQRQGECRKKRTGSLPSTTKCNSELWEHHVVPCYGMDKHWWLCIALTCWADNYQPAK